MIDLGTSAFMGTDLQFRQRLGIPLPEGVALDERGRPTTDAGAARRGAILPFGGHKGYALALATHALGVLCSAVPTEESTGYLFIAFKPDLFVPLDDYRRALAAEIAAIKATPRQEGVAEIRIPGERAYRERDAPHARGHRDRPAHSGRVDRARRGQAPRLRLARGVYSRPCERTRSSNGSTPARPPSASCAPSPHRPWWRCSATSASTGSCSTTSTAPSPSTPPRRASPPPSSPAWRRSCARSGTSPRSSRRSWIGAPGACRFPTSTRRPKPGPPSTR